VCKLNAQASNWVQLGQDIDGEAADGRFGSSVSLSADGLTLAVGAWHNDGTNGSNSGHVCVFKFDSNTGSWTQIGNDIDGEVVGDLFGMSVSLLADGTALAVGAKCNDGNGKSSWVQIGINIKSKSVIDWFGSSVSLSVDGAILAVGVAHNDGNGIDSGHICVFKFDSTTGSWPQLGDDIDGEVAGDEFGRLVSLSADGTKLAIGVWHNDGNGSNSGHVRIHGFRAEAGWTQIGNDTDGEVAGDQFGWSISLLVDGTVVAVRANKNDGTNGENSGHVRVCHLGTDASDWKQVGQDVDGEAAEDAFGWQVSLSADGT